MFRKDIRQIFVHNFQKKILNNLIQIILKNLIFKKLQAKSLDME